MKTRPTSSCLALSALPSRRLLRPLTASSPLFPLLAPSLIFSRSILGIGKKAKEPINNTKDADDATNTNKDGDDASNASQEPRDPASMFSVDYLKRKPPPPPPLVRGRLSSSSIFETAEARSTRGRAEAKRRSMIDSPALDPDPSARKRWERKMVIRSLRQRGRLTKKQELKQTERELLAKSCMFKTSVKKLGPLARQIAGKSVDDAIVQMRFSKKKVAKKVMRHLVAARNHAIVRRGMALGEAENSKGDPVEIELKNGKRRLVEDRTALYIDQAWVGRGRYGIKVSARAFGRRHLQRPPHTRISILLKEEATRVRISEEIQEKRAKRKLWVHLPNRPITAQRQYYSW